MIRGNKNMKIVIELEKPKKENVIASMQRTLELYAKIETLEIEYKDVIKTVRK